MVKHLLSDIALFIEVVQSKSFVRAAERMDIPASTLSRRVSALERTIGFRLLNRTTRKVEATEEGMAYYQRCKHLVDEATLAHEEISDAIHVASGVLRVTCTPDFANLHLAPVLTRYAKENPAVRVEISLSSQVEDLLTNHLDLAIRMGPLRDSNLIARPLGALKLGIYASPAFMKSCGAVIKVPQDLSKVDCIRLTANESASIWSMRPVDAPEGPKLKVNINGRFVSGGPHLACQLALQGCGVALLDERLANVYRNNGELVRLLPEWIPSEVKVQALTTSRLIPARVRRFIELLEHALSGRFVYP
ncbi:MAG: LysR family transcriptional regulator [Rhodoferax sp.]|nr:LysR family transcriptional regulator [Rhodoferax sp.]